MKLSAVIFPDTLLSERMSIPLVPVFQPLVYLQPVENDPAPGQARSAFCEELLRQSFCRVQVPAPLGEDRERFLRLVTDLRNRRDDYAAQLSHQTLAGISSASRKRTETKSSIVGSLLAGHGIRDAGSDPRKMLLWQSRLLLKLAEMLTADQEEQRQQVSRIREKERGLFAGLREEGGGLFVLPGGLDPVSMDTAALRQQRKAWARLLVLGEAPDDISGVVLSRDKDGVDLLCEEYEKRMGSTPFRLGQLSLPATCPDPDGFVEQVRQFRAEGADLLARLQAWFATSLEADVQGQAFSGEEQGAWEELLSRFFPESRCGRARLTLFACPGRSVRQLFAETFAPDELEFVKTPESTTEACVVLGVLEEE